MNVSNPCRCLWADYKKHRSKCSLSFSASNSEGKVSEFTTILRCGMRSMRKHTPEIPENPE